MRMYDGIRGFHGGKLELFKAEYAVLMDWLNEQEKENPVWVRTLRGALLRSAMTDTYREKTCFMLTWEEMSLFGKLFFGPRGAKGSGNEDAYWEHLCENGRLGNVY